MNIAICDDNAEYISTMENYIDKLSDKHLECDIFFRGDELIRAYENGSAHYDAVFLGIEMGELNGIDTANLLRQYDRNVIIVFVTGFAEYMKDSFECSPFRFLLKPISYDDFCKVYEEVKAKLAEERKVFIFSENRIKIRLYCEDIILFETQGHTLWIHTRERKYKVFKSMTELCKNIDTNSFCRVHNSYTINFAYVKEVRDNEISLYDCDIKIPIGRTYKKEFTKQFMSFKERKYVVI